MIVSTLAHNVEAREPCVPGELLHILAHDVESPAYKMLRELIATYPTVFGRGAIPRCSLDAIDLLCRGVDAANELIENPRIE